METQNKEYKKANVNFSILKSAKKTFVFYYKNAETFKDLRSKYFSKIEVLKTGTQDLDVFLTNEILEFACIQAVPNSKFPKLFFGTMPQRKNKEYSVYWAYREDRSDRKFFKTDKQYWFNIFRLNEISQEIVEKYTQFHELESIAELLEIEVEGNTKKEEKGEN